MSCPNHRRNLKECSSLIRCPYSQHHHISPHHFASHLMECRREYCTTNAATVKFIRCRYNSRHHVPEVEIKFHEKHCRDKDYEFLLECLSTAPVPVVVRDDSESTSDSDTSSSSSSTHSDTVGNLESTINV